MKQRTTPKWKATIRTDQRKMAGSGWDPKLKREINFTIRGIKRKRYA